MIKHVMGFTALRIFLHSSIYEGLGKEKMLINLHKLLDIAESNEIKLGFVGKMRFIKYIYILKDQPKGIFIICSH